MQHQKPPDPPTRHPQGEGGNHIHYLIPPTYIVRAKKYMAMTPQLQIYFCYLYIYTHSYVLCVLLQSCIYIYIYIWKGIICVYIYTYTTIEHIEYIRTTYSLSIYIYEYMCIYIYKMNMCKPPSYYSSGANIQHLTSSPHPPTPQVGYHNTLTPPIPQGRGVPRPWVRGRGDPKPGTYIDMYIHNYITIICIYIYVYSVCIYIYIWRRSATPPPHPPGHGHGPVCTLYVGGSK